MSAQRVLWFGAPGGGPVRLRAQDLLFVPFSLAWAALIAVSLVTVAQAGAWRTSSGAALLLMSVSALYLLAGRFAVDAFVRRHTAYRLTDETIEIVGGLFGNKTTLRLDRIRQIALRERRNGFGTIIFGRWSWWVDEVPVGTRAGAFAPRLEEIAEVRRVYELIQALRLFPPFAIPLHGIDDGE